MNTRPLGASHDDTFLNRIGYAFMCSNISIDMMCVNLPLDVFLHVVTNTTHLPFSSKS